MKEFLKEQQRDFDQRRLEHIADQAWYEEFEKMDVDEETRWEGKLLFDDLNRAWDAYETKYTKMMEAAGIVWDQLD